MSYWTLDKRHDRPSRIVYASVWMTPALAKEILETRNARNRKMKLKFIRRLSCAIRSGEWQDGSHQGIAFSADGVLLDGQNRLQAIVEANVPVQINVAYNVPDLAQAYMDSGNKRDDSERQKFGFGVDVDRDDTAIARAMIGRGRWVDVGDRDLNSFLSDHLEAIRFARTAYPKRWRNGSKSLWAVLARAYYHVDGGRLIRFCHVVNLEPYESHEQAAAQWGKELRGDSQKYAKALHQRMSAPEIFDRTQRALCSFLRGDQKKVTKPDSRNLFPLPGEDESESVSAATIPQPAGQRLAPMTFEAPDLSGLSVGSNGAVH